jgi:ketosteroid isomerase-like protein
LRRGNPINRREIVACVVVALRQSSFGRDRQIGPPDRRRLPIQIVALHPFTHAGSNAMNRLVSTALIARALLFSVVVLLAGNARTYAQEVDIKAAVDAYHAALGSLDIAKMEPLWAHDADVMLVNPADKSISVGWDAARKDWEAQFAFLSDLKVTQADGPHIAVKGDVAWSTGIANAAAKSKSGADVGGLVYESDVFENRGGQWLLVSHTALAVPKPM